MASYQEFLCHNILLVFVAFALTLGSNGVEGRKKILKKEGLELESLLNSLNKPAEKIIQTKEGDAFNCVDINKQLAFDHPLLKNHTIQMKPSSFPKGMANGAATLIRPLIDSLKNEGCPLGTVPIRKIEREDLVRLESFSKRNSRNADLLSSNQSPYHFAAIKMGGDASVKYYGARGIMNIYRTQVLDNQFTEGVIWVQNGSKDQLNNIQAGWTVNPMLFNDSQIHIFVSWTVDGNQKTGCFNILCPGFVQVSKKYAVGQVLEHTSEIGGKQYGYDNYIFKDSKTGNWWFVTTGNEPVGYWPNSIFTNFDSASEIHWGGEVYSPLNEVMPPMGSGHFVSKTFDKTAFIMQMQAVDETYTLVAPDESKMKLIMDNSNCYKAEYYGFYGSRGYTMMYGGPMELSCNA